MTKHAHWVDQTEEILRGQRPWQEVRDEDVAKQAEAKRKVIKPVTKNHAWYMRAIETSTITICTGPAGTGKTFMACYLAARMLQAGRIERIVLTRPMVSCGKGYGFRPGTTEEKFLPDVRPLLEALGEFMAPKELQFFLDKKVVELWPLDDMRGANIRKSFIICDEAQNAEGNQLYMLLTRFAEGSRVVLCGDATSGQIDRPGQGPNPLREVIRKFAPDCHPDVSIVRFTREDIVRHGLIRWVDERLSTDVVLTEQGSEVEEFDQACLSCSAGLRYSEPPGPGLDQIECCECGSLMDLYEPWNGDTLSPHLVTSRHGRLGKTQLKGLS